MNPLRLRARCFGPYEELDIEFQDGCTAVLGEIRNAPAGISSNGAGKSTILNGIALALFGPGDGMRSLAPYLTRDSDETELMIELEFEHGGETYRVRRGYSARGAGKSTLDLEWYDTGPRAMPAVSALHPATIRANEHRWEPLTRASTKETQAELERILGLSRETFLASSLALQGAGSFADPAVNPAARKRLLADALGLDRWDRYHDQAKQDRKVREQELVQLATRIGGDRVIVETRDKVLAAEADVTNLIAADEQTLAEAEARLEDLTGRHTDAREAREKVSTAVARVDAAESEQQRVDEIAAAADRAREAVGPLEARQRELHPLVEELPAHEAQEARLRDLVAEHRRLVAEREERIRARDDMTRRANELREKAEDADLQADAVLAHVGEATCDRCGQTLGLEAARRASESFLADMRCWTHEADELADSARRIEVPDAGDPPTEALEAMAMRVHAGRQARVELAQLAERIHAEREKIAAAETDEFRADCKTAYQGLVAAVTGLQEARQKAPTDQDLAKLLGEIGVERVVVAKARRSLDSYRASQARYQERLDRIKEAETRLGEHEARTHSLQAEVDVLTMLERAYSRDGIPALILENAAVPFIEAEASRILAELGTGFRVELRTQAALKTGDGVRDTLDVVVVTEDGLEQPYGLCSGGEATRIGLALRIALAGLLAHRMGAESRLLAIDEPSFLDAAGMQRLVEILRGLEGTFSKLILVSHVSELRDAFDQVIVVQKDGTRARVVTADREAVLA